MYRHGVLPLLARNTSRPYVGLGLSGHATRRMHAKVSRHARPLMVNGTGTQSDSRITAGPIRHSHQRRSLSLSSLPTVLVAPTVFTGLLLGLWAYKCFMTVIFQDKIIYMPYMPPFARAAKIEDYASSCKPVEWREERIRSVDGTRISLCVGRMPQSVAESAASKVAVCYFQGNGSSTPPRLPLLSQVVKLLRAGGMECTAVALSYRGYWKSSGRASQRGIELDAQATLDWMKQNFGDDTPLILWGQSIGAGIASTAAAHHLAQHKKPSIKALVMETPFTSVKSMLLALYPQKWLPYRYLHPFLWNQWDSEVALRTIAAQPVQGQTMRLLLMPATRDEVVPSEEIGKLEQICKDVALPYERKDIVGALHTEATVRRDGQQAVASFIRRAIVSP